jgi:hypothetical protein
MLKENSEISTLIGKKYEAQKILGMVITKVVMPESVRCML